MEIYSMNHSEIYSRNHSDSKASPKSDNVNNAERTAKPEAAESAVKTDCVKTEPSNKAV